MQRWEDETLHIGMTRDQAFELLVALLEVVGHEARDAVRPELQGAFAAALRDIRRRR